jgi:hypothetical protein
LGSSARLNDFLWEFNSTKNLISQRKSVPLKKKRVKIEASKKYLLEL